MEFAGRLEAIQSVDLRARVGGALIKINFEAGTEVKKGEVLFEIDPQPYQIALERSEAEERLAQARKSFADAALERASKLAGAISQEELAQLALRSTEARETLTVAKADSMMARLNLDYTKVRSPIDGSIGQELVTPGNIVRADETIVAHVASLDPIRAVFAMEERDLLRLVRFMQARKLTHDQLQVSVRVPGSDETAFKGKLTFVDNRIHPETAGVRVSAVIANPQRLLLPGMSAKIMLHMDAPK